MRRVVRTSLLAATANAFNCDGCATEMTTAVMTAMKSSVRHRLASHRHTSLAETDTAYQPGGGVMVLKIVLMEAMKWWV